MATGTSDPQADRGLAGSLSTQSTTRGSRASLQPSITTSPRLHTSEGPFVQSSTAFHPHAGILAESQSVRPASSYVNSVGWLAGQEAGYPTARPRIGHPRTQGAEAASNSFSNTGGASRGEPENRRSGVTGTREGQVGKGSRSVFSWVNTQRDAIEADLRYARAHPIEGSHWASELQTPHSDSAVSTQRSLNTCGYESKSPKISFKILFASGRGREARESEIVYKFLGRIKSHHNMEVPSQHTRMRNGFSGLDEWDLIRRRVGRAGAEILALNSPAYQFYDNDLPSSWRSDVKATWRFLHQHYGFLAHGTFLAETQILLDPKCNSVEFKRISQAIIHFEPVLDTMASDHHRSTQTASPAHRPSYWRETPGMANKSRHEAILYIENELNLEQLLNLRGNLGIANSWSTSIQSSHYRPPEVFRNAPEIRTADDLVYWGEFVMSFVEASLSCALPRLLRFPPNQIGLTRFLLGRGRGTEMMYDRHIRLTRMFHGLSEGGVYPHS